MRSRIPGPSSGRARSTQSPRLRQISNAWIVVKHSAHRSRPSSLTVISRSGQPRHTASQRSKSERCSDGKPAGSIAGHDRGDAVGQWGLAGERAGCYRYVRRHFVSHPSHCVGTRREGTRCDGYAPMRWARAVDPSTTRESRRPGTIAAKADVAQDTMQQNPLHSTTRRADDRDSAGSWASHSARSGPLANRSARRRSSGRPAARRRLAVRRRPGLC
jgi:hypothetical protein